MRSLVRRLPGGGAPVSLILVGCLVAAGCGSSQHKTVATTTAATAPTQTNAEHPATTRKRAPHPPAAHRNNGRPGEATALTSPAAALATAALPRRQTQAANTAEAAARRAAARNPANKTCKLTVEGRTVPVACALARPLQRAALRNKALAELLARAAARSR
jgi:hypothetical protein